MKYSYERTSRNLWENGIKVQFYIGAKNLKSIHNFCIIFILHELMISKPDPVTTTSFQGHES